jgi:16S rRNA (cytosine1402-N4)-methyltransferase
VISFHSLEDRRAKSALSKVPAVWHSLAKKPVEAGPAEVARNPRARSAKLRAARRVGPDGA